METQETVNYIVVAMIAIYLVGTTLVGSLLAARSKSSSDWAVAGGGMSILMVAVGIAGTRVGGAATYGVAGDVIKTGVWNMWYGVNSFLAMALTGIFFAVAYRRLKLHTVSEIFTRRFGSRRSQVLTSLCVQTEYFVVNLIEIYVIAKILNGVFPDMSYGLGVVIGAVIIITYTVLGGLWGSAATNLIHCAAILFGLLWIGLAGQSKLGGWSEVTSAVNASLDAQAVSRDSWWSFAGLGWGAIFGMFFSATIHTPAASVYTNFASASRSERAIIPAFLLGGLLAAPMSWLAGWIGILTLARFGGEKSLPGYQSIAQLAFDVSPVMGGVAMAAVLAAVISSGGPILLASATMFVRDWIPVSREWNPDKLLKAYRITTVTYGLISAIIVYIVKTINVLDLLLLGFAAVVPPAIAIGYVIYMRRTNEKGCFWGIMAGYVGGVIWFALIEWATKTGFELSESAGLLERIFYTCFARNGEGIDPSYATTIIPLIVVPIVSLFTQPDESGADEFYAIVKTPSPGAAQ